MLQLACPTCGAALEHDGVQTVVRCGYCGTTVAIPEIARPQPAAYTPDPQVPDPTLTEVAALLRAGRRVKGTTLYREITGAGLDEARLAVDRFLAGEPLRRPNKLA